MTPPTPPADRVRDDGDVYDADDLHDAPDEELSEATTARYEDGPRRRSARDGTGHEVHGKDEYGPDGERVEAAVGKRPEEIGSPDAAALRRIAKRDDRA